MFPEHFDLLLGARELAGLGVGPRSVVTNSFPMGGNL